MPRDKDSVSHTVIVAVVLSLVCSIAVSAVAVFLRPAQEANKEQFRKENILAAAENVLEEYYAEREGVRIDFDDVEEVFEQHIEAIFVELGTTNTPEAIADPTKEGESLTPDRYEQKQAAGDERFSVVIPREENVAGLTGGRRELYSLVYVVKGLEGETLGYVLPIRGYGLWSTLWGFIALDADGETIRGLTYYEHGETPGLGGEVDNPTWKAKWDGKKAFDEEGNVVVEVVKGTAAEEPGADETQIDGLAGATITSRGVGNMIKYWLGPNAFGPFLEPIREGGGNADG